MPKPALAKKSSLTLKLLLVEDTASDASLVSNLLDLTGTAEYRVTHVSTQAEALVALEDQHFDVCLLDLTLPDANEFSALIDIQNKSPDMPVLILTGINDAELAKRAVSRGAQDYLLKDELRAEALERAVNYAIERKRTEKTLLIRANQDGLTGLANYDSFLGRLQMAMARFERTGMGTAILFIDLNGFKSVNDTYGHDAGDEVLRVVADRLKKSLRGYDTAARLGGDEFAALLEGIAYSRDAAAVARKIIHAVSVPIYYKRHELSVGASIGIAYASANIEAKTLLQHADIAMYQAKKEGSGYRFYSSEMQDEVSARLKLEDDLHHALTAGELRLYYQPYVRPSDEAILGVEVLLRWSHPERGLLSANEFLSAAEAARLMPEIGAWMGRQLRHDILQWNTGKLPPIEIAINLSASQLDDPKLEQWLIPLTQKELLGHHKIVVEVPEGAIVHISGSRFMALSKLHDLHIDFHLDRCGMNALPLTALTSIPFSLLKIDTSLIKDMSKKNKDNILISSTIMLAHHLGMKVAAVGVEAPWQLKSLKMQSCDAIQGFLTGQPMTARQLTDWLKR